MKRLHIRLSAIFAFILACGLLLFALGPAHADVDDSYSVALLHMNGADASTTFTDESGKGWTAYGNAQIDTAQSVFGGASGLFDGNGDYISTADSLDWQLDGGSNSNSWTIDFRVRFNGDPGTAEQGFIRQKQSNGTDMRLLLINNILYFQVVSSGSAIINDSEAWNPSGDTWYHIALVKNGTNGYMWFVDGNQIGNTTPDTDTIPNYAGPFEWGLTDDSSGNHYWFNGWLDETRASKGIARWTANFTPPNAEYPDRTVQTATAAAQQTQTASALTATAANVQTQTAAAYQTQTAAVYQTQTAVAYQTQTAAANQTGTAAVATANFGHDVETVVAAYKTQFVSITNTPTLTATATLTGTPNPAAQFESTISYGDIARTNVLACIATIGGLWAIIWAVTTFFAKRRRT